VEETDVLADTMTQSLPSLLERFGELPVLVVGDSILDVYLRGATTRLSREAPVPVVNLDERVEAPGGAANAAVNLACLGARVELLSVIGDDRAGKRLLELLEAARVGVEHLVVQRGRRTQVKRRLISDGQMLARVDDGDSGPAGEAAHDRLLHALRRRFGESEAVLVSDYGCGVGGRPLADALRSLQDRTPRVLVVDAKRPAAYHEVGVTAAKPNYNEAVELLGIGRLPGTGRRVEQLQRQGERLRSLLGAEIVAVTLDSDGALLFEPGEELPYRTYVRARPSSLATGAGDTFASVLALALASGADVPAAGELASAATELVVSRPGTAVCDADALRRTVLGPFRRLAGVDELVAEARLHRQRGRRIVFTNGCFDILHRGHVGYLNRAKALGDVLIVGVNSDASVRRLKGPDRPLNALEDRMAVLGALSCIDHLIAFDDDTPAELLRALRPEAFVKGGDYRLDTLPEAPLVAELGGEVVLLPYLEDHSTSEVIRRIRERVQ
jgi:D-beta-D-heptose 7-phosphate kinase / D-beta-D-heptose 1-phosphate adenosyltransferase